MKTQTSTTFEVKVLDLDCKTYKWSISAKTYLWRIHME